MPRAGLKPGSSPPSNSTPGHYVDLQYRIGSGHVCGRHTSLAPYDVGSLGDGAGHVEGDLAIAALPAEAAVARYDQAFGRNVSQRFADLARHIFGPVGLQGAMAHDPDADLLLQIVLEGLEQLDILLVAILHLQRPDIAAAALQIDFERVGVAGVLHHALHVRIAPAGVNPQFHVVESLHFAIERIDHELHFLVVLAISVRHEVEGGLLDLYAAAAGVAQRQQLLVHGLRHIPDHLA